MFDLRLGLFLLSKPEKSPWKSQQERFSSHTSLLYTGAVFSSLRPNSFKSETKFWMMQLWYEGQAVTSVVCIPNVH